MLHGNVLLPIVSQGVQLSSIRKTKETDDSQILESEGYFKVKDVQSNSTASQKKVWSTSLIYASCLAVCSTT